MSLTDDSANVAFAAPHFDIDKIVGVWEGSFNRATDVVSRVGDAGTIYVYRIAHGFTRPVFADLMFTTASGFVDGGSADSNGETSLAFSDSTYIYIISSLFAPAVGTMRYKVLATWIDNYDDSNPSVTPYKSPTKDINFDSRLNYQKIQKQGALTFNSATLQTVTHSLNRLANFRVFFESFPNEVWPMHSGGASNPFLYDNNDMSECSAVMKINTMDIEMFVVPTPRRAWYKIYLDR